MCPELERIFFVCGVYCFPILGQTTKNGNRKPWSSCLVSSMPIYKLCHSVSSLYLHTKLFQNQVSFWASLVTQRNIFTHLSHPSFQKYYFVRISWGDRIFSHFSAVTSINEFLTNLIIILNFPVNFSFLLRIYVVLTVIVPRVKRQLLVIRGFTLIYVYGAARAPDITEIVLT